MSTEVTWFSSADPNAPQLDGTAGSLIAVLDACLINGYGTVTVASITVTDDLATVTVDAGHGFGDACVVEISGANEAAFVGRKKITVLNATQFTFPAVGAPAEATGTITAKRAPVGGWEKAFSDTGIAVYKSTDPAAYGGGYYLRVAPGPNTSVAEVLAYGVMTGHSIGTDATTLRYAWISSSAPWKLFADSRWIWLTSNLHLLAFGDVLRFDPADVGATLLAARSSTDTTASRPYQSLLSPFAVNNVTPRWLYAKDGTTANRVARVMGAMGGTGSISATFTVIGRAGGGGAPANWLNVWASGGPVTAIDDNDGGMPRGWLPGAHCPVHGESGAPDHVVTPDGRRFALLRQRSSYDTSSVVGAVWIDLDGPWR